MRCETPICGAARPAPFFAAMVSFMSSSSARSSGVPKASTGFAFSRSTGCPILSTSRTAMSAHHFRHDLPCLAHGLLDDAPDVVERHGVRAAAASGGRVHDDAQVHVLQAQLARERGL